MGISWTSLSLSSDILSISLPVPIPQASALASGRTFSVTL